MLASGQAGSAREGGAAVFERVLIALVFVNVALMATFRLGDYDIWYHLSAGRYIIDTGGILHADPFSYTAADRPWSVQSWLAGVLFYGIHAAAGVGGLILSNAAVIALSFFLVFRTMRRSARGEGDLLLAAGLIILAAATSRLRFMVRPHALEFLCLAAELLLLERFRRGDRRSLVAVPFVHLLWVNVHGSHILGLVLPLLYLAGAALQRLLPALLGEEAERVPAPGKPIRSYALLLAANAAATLVNPVTYRAFLLPFQILGQETYMRSIGEWQAFSFLHLAPYNLRYTGGFVLLTLIVVAGFVRNRKRLDSTDLLLAGVFFLLALRGIRLMAEFAIVAAPVALRNWRGILPSGAWLRGPAVRTTLVALLVVVLPTLTIRSPTYAFGLGVKEEKFPIKAWNFVERIGLDGTLYNSFAFGDYLCWRAFPRRKVFIHGRNDVFPQEFFAEYAAARDTSEGWQRAVEKYGITYALIQYAGSGFDGMHRNAHLATDPSWIPVYWDMAAAVYVRDIPRNRELIERHGFRYIRPANFSLKYLSPLLSRGLGGAVTAELDRLLRESPGNEEGYIARASVAFVEGGAGVARAEKDLMTVLALNPKRSMSYTALGMVRQDQGRRDEALRSFEEALRLNPEDEIARTSRERLLTGVK